MGAEGRSVLEASPEDVAGAERRRSPFLGEHLPLLLIVSAVLSREILWLPQYFWGPIQDRRQCGGADGLRLIYGANCVRNKAGVFTETAGSQLRLPYPLTGHRLLLRVPGSKIQHASPYNSRFRHHTTVKK